LREDPTFLLRKINRGAYQMSHFEWRIVTGKEKHG